MAVIDAAYWESLCSREHKAAEEVTRAEMAVIEAAHWKNLCSAGQLGLSVQDPIAVPTHRTPS